MSDRLPCLVPFCRCTCKAERRFAEWICAAHWRLVSIETKASLRKWSRFAFKAHLRGLTTPNIFARADAAWERCKAEAIERAVGITA